jgi:alpha-1,3-rhamnosyltransferase
MEADSPLVSVVVITYNSSPYIIETLESVKHQSYNKIELIITDDASKDDTVSICEEWLEQNQNHFKYARIIKTKQNTGLAGNFNRGVNAAQGKWIKPLAGDDILKRDCISYNINEIQKIGTACAVYATQKLLFSELDGEKQFKYPNKTKTRSLFFNDKITPKQQLMLAVRNIEQPSITGLFFKRDMFLNIGGCDERFQMLEDRPLIHKILLNGYKIYGSNYPTVLKRVHEKSIYRSKADQYIITPWKKNYYIPVQKEYFLPHLTYIEKPFHHYALSIIDNIYGTKLNNRESSSNNTIYRILMYPFNMYSRIRRRVVLAIVYRKFNK